MNNNRLYIVMYHYIRDLEHSRYPNIKGLDYSLFERQLQFFAGHMNVITMQDTQFILRGGGYFLQMLSFSLSMMDTSITSPQPFLYSRSMAFRVPSLYQEGLSPKTLYLT